jgi:hypothetical protein
MHLASQGRVVLALEHRDGSGAATFPRSYNGAPHIVRYLSPGEVIWPDGATSPRANEWVRGGYNDEVALRLRKDQLDFRRREIYEAIHAIGLLHEGQRAKSALEVFGDKSINWDAWKGAIDTSNVDLIGHSFGGATVVSLPWYMLHLELNVCLFPVLDFVAATTVDVNKSYEALSTDTDPTDACTRPMDGATSIARPETILGRQERCGRSPYASSAAGH